VSHDILAKDDTEWSNGQCEWRRHTARYCSKQRNCLNSKSLFTSISSRWSM